MLPQAPSTPPRAEESQELVRFREEWKAELRSRKAASGKASVQLDAVLSGSKLRGVYAARGSSISHAHATGSVLTHLAGASALTTYRRAIEHEQRGDYDDAISLYRQAFRADAHVDRLYHEEEMLASIAAARSTSPSKIHLVVDRPVKNMATPVISATGTLASVIGAFPSNLKFYPEVEQVPIHLSHIPDELILRILRELDPTSIESFASVCRKSRVITLDFGIWRHLVEAIYKSPQTEDVSVALEHYAFDYRRLFVELPRIRLDGVYIATCHYVRQGLGDNNWINVTHAITYQRYLRFYLNGQVLSLLVNEDSTPHQIIPLLKPTLRMKGLYIGKWRLTDTTIEISNLLDASGRFPISIDGPCTSHLSQEGEVCQYSFNMTLNLTSRPLGRWNKMTIGAYNSVNLETGDVVPVALKHEKPFWFSKRAHQASSPQNQEALSPSESASS